MSDTRAKFTCQSVKKQRGWGGHPFVYEAEFQAVMGSDKGEENARFFAATPAGTIRLSTVAHDVFEVGRDYYVDFTPASNQA